MRAKISPRIGRWWQFPYLSSHRWASDTTASKKCQFSNNSSTLDKLGVEMWHSRKQTRNTGLAETKRLRWERYFFKTPVKSPPVKFPHGSPYKFSIPPWLRAQTDNLLLQSCLLLSLAGQSQSYSAQKNFTTGILKWEKSRPRWRSNLADTAHISQNMQITQVTITTRAVCVMPGSHLTKSVLMWVLPVFVRQWNWFRKSSYKHICEEFEELNDKIRPVPNMSSDGPDVES